jgi:hypothetical protein
MSNIFNNIVNSVSHATTDIFNEASRGLSDVGQFVENLSQDTYDSIVKNDVVTDAYDGISDLLQSGWSQTIQPAYDAIASQTTQTLHDIGYDDDIINKPVDLVLDTVTLGAYTPIAKVTTEVAGEVGDSIGDVGVDINRWVNNGVGDFLGMDIKTMILIGIGGTLLINLTEGD